MRKLKIYLDNCCYNRPFDNLIQDKIRLESEAILSILNKVSNNEIALYSSLAIDFELSKMKDNKKKMQVMSFYISSRNILLDFKDEINLRANELSRFNIKYMDALHIAFCEYYELDYMLTTDKVLLNTVIRSELNLRVVNPLDFVMEVC